jgi:leucyl/phenylalanyl-tRNA--protein transferase
MLPVAILDSRLRFPPVEMAHRGLVAVGGDLSVRRLLLAYRSGIFPWSVDPITWWSPDPRAVFNLDAIHVPRSLRRTLRSGRFVFTQDQAFFQVIQACAEAPRRQDDTWITDEIIFSYGQLHRQGHAHSFECWMDGALVGGLYGVAIGGFFAGESMFHRVPDASKACVVELATHLKIRGYTLFDTQMVTDTTQLLGAREIPRAEYIRRLNLALQLPCTYVDR